MPSPHWMIPTPRTVWVQSTFSSNTLNSSTGMKIWAASTTQRTHCLVKPPQKHYLLISFYSKQKAVSTITSIQTSACVFRTRPQWQFLWDTLLPWWTGQRPASQSRQPSGPGEELTLQMRSSAHLSDCNRICLRRSVPICIRQTFNVGFQERLDSSLRESNIGFETLDRGKNAWSTQDICILTLKLFQSNHLNPIKRTLSSRS